MRGRHHRIFAARHIAADRLDRDVPVAEHHARQRLDLDVADRLPLLLGEVLHLRLGEADVAEIARRDLAHRRLDLGLAQAKALRRPSVEALRQLAHGDIAPRLDVGQDLLDGGAHLAVRFGARRGRFSRFQMGGHELLRITFWLAVQPISDVSRPRVICEMVTARISAAPLNTLVTQSGMPSIDRPVMPVAKK